MENYSLLTRKDILIPATIWMILKNIMLRETANHKKTNVIRFQSNS